MCVSRLSPYYESGTTRLHHSVQVGMLMFPLVGYEM